mmetsp:Transcript_6043/g.8175  ORF Transcript_6043/g.8175 Transcript_6043/m.8175 type:complete len:167 (+) Transcript_6043:217-717(+)|eukprot:CAMPEP_0196579536 /NCGR_PEP_ID=MMETSP1081-20130531/22416_1 /TAXON_ID=36882 /ORGANISM="Pyramimonas amylifera, Strain CCMP720" /LENGTH=166 /DNA_ID=CAMNT_0041899159 /DNA_START=209 /DNA_END=709 /DNA_ORIENTATION=+
MAKWGEGDPRWKVEERADGTNVNGWHWQERNCLGWSRTWMEEGMVGMTIRVPPEEATAKVSAFKSLEGDASLSIRKGNKKVAVFDLKLVFSYEASMMSDPEKVYKGEVKIDEFASANEEDEYMWSITIEGKGKTHSRMKHLVDSAVRRDFLPKLKEYQETMAVLDL